TTRWRTRSTGCSRRCRAGEPAALEEARREAGRGGRRLLHHASLGARVEAAGAEGDSGAGGRPLDRLAEEGGEARDRHRLRRGAVGRTRGRTRRQQELLDRRELAGPALRVPPRGPLRRSAGGPAAGLDRERRRRERLPAELADPGD